MADVKISELSDAATLTGAEEVELVQGGANAKATVDDVADRTVDVVTGQVNEWDVNQEAGFFNLGSGPTLTATMNAGVHFYSELTQNATLSFANILDGASGRIYITQDGTGGWVLSFDASIKFAGGTPVTISTDPGSQTIIPFTVDRLGNVTLHPSSEDVKVA